MKGLRTGVLAVAVFGLAGPVAAQVDEEVAVREAVELYMRSHATGEGEHVAKVFHSDLVMYFLREGALTQRTGTDFIAGFRGQPQADEAQRRRWIDMVDVSGDAAVAKVILDYPAVRITDYFTLLKIDGNWKIMNKVFNSEPKGG